MTTEQLEASISEQRALIEALSARIDSMDRTELGKSVVDERQRRLAARHADAFGAHKGDGFAHVGATWPEKRAILDMDEVRDDEGDASAPVYAAIEVSDSIAVPGEWETVLASNTSVLSLSQDKRSIAISRRGYYMVYVAGDLTVEVGVSMSSANVTIEHSEALWMTMGLEQRQVEWMAGTDPRTRRIVMKAGKMKLFLAGANDSLELTHSATGSVENVSDARVGVFLVHPL